MNSRKVQIVLALSLCLSLSLPARDASAMISINLWELFLLGLPYALEPLSPDIYVEWSDERSEAVLDTYQCVCKPGWSGARCDTQVSE